MLRRPVGVDDQLEGRPCRRRRDLEERLPAHPPRRREPHPAAGALHEPDPVRPDFGLGLEQWVADTRKGERLRADLHERRADERAAGVARVDDLALVDLDPGLQLVRFTEAVLVAEKLELAGTEPVGRRVVVRRHPDLEGKLGHPFDRLRRDPCDRCHGLLHSHAHPPLIRVQTILTDSEDSPQTRRVSLAYIGYRCK